MHIAKNVDKYYIGMVLGRVWRFKKEDVIKNLLPPTASVYTRNRDFFNNDGTLKRQYCDCPIFEVGKNYGY